MSPRVLLVIGVLLVATSAGIAASHYVPWPLTARQSVVPVARVQRTVRRYTIVLGVIEALALVALIAVLFSVPPGTTTMWLVGVAALCVAAMLGVWVAWVRPLNATIAGWVPETLPKDWTRHHERWTGLHGLRVVLGVIALALLLIGLFARPAG